MAAVSQRRRMNTTVIAGNPDIRQLSLNNSAAITKQAVTLAKEAGVDTGVADTAAGLVTPIALGVTAASVGAQIGEWLSDQTQPPASRALSGSLKALPAPSTPSSAPSPTPAGTAGCGTVTTADSPTSPSLVTVRIIQGNTACSEALAIAQSYYRGLLQGQGEGSGAFLTVNGWLCGTNPILIARQTNHVSGCTKGSDSIGMDQMHG